MFAPVMHAGSMMQKARRTGRFLASIGMLALAGGVIYLTRGVPQREITGSAEAIDGDSLKLSGEEIRLKGIDAPELNQICRVSGRDTPCGREARAQLRRLLASGLTTCLGEERDRYGRLLSICRVRGIEINAAMVREGHAVAFGGYTIEETEARGAYRGLWAGTFERPRDWRAAHPQSPR